MGLLVVVVMRAAAPAAAMVVVAVVVVTFLNSQRSDGRETLMAKRTEQTCEEVLVEFKE